MTAPPATTVEPERSHWSPAASGARRCLGGFLHVLDVAAARAADHPQAFDELRSGALQAVVVRGLYPAQAMAAAVERLARHDPPFLKTGFPPAFRAWFYGRNINLSDPALSGYFEQARLFDRQLRSLMPDDQSLVARVGAVLSALDGGRAFIAAPGPQPDERYMFTTLRAHLEHGFIPPHFDNEVRLRPSYRHLAGLVDAHIVSFVLTFDPGEQDGALEVFDLRCEPQQARLLNDDHAVAQPDTARLASVSFRLDPGDLIVLDSGRYLHRLSPVQGRRTRWTACSFMARALSADAMYCWG
jgi:hypothetical protein